MVESLVVKERERGIRYGERGRHVRAGEGLFWDFLVPRPRHWTRKLKKDPLQLGRGGPDLCKSSSGFIFVHKSMVPPSIVSSTVTHCFQQQARREAGRGAAERRPFSGCPLPAVTERDGGVEPSPELRAPSLVSLPGRDEDDDGRDQLRDTHPPPPRPPRNAPHRPVALPWRLRSTTRPGQMWRQKNLFLFLFFVTVIKG